MKKQVIYLKNGQEANLIKKIDDSNFLVEPVFHFQSEYNGDWLEDFGEQKVVSEIFYTAPVEKIEPTYKAAKEQLDEAKQQLSELSAEVRTAKRELERIEGQKTDMSNLIFNRSELKNAKRIVVFPIGGYSPVDVTSTLVNTFKLNIYLNIYKDDQRAWYYKIDKNGNGSEWSVSADSLLIDKTEEEIEAFAIARCDSMDVKNANLINLERTPDKYLNHAFLARKREREAQVAQQGEQKRKEEIEKLEKRLEELKKP